MGLMTRKRMRAIEAKIGDIDQQADTTEVPITDGSILIGDSGGEGAVKALSGDMTIDREGVVTIGAAKIDTAMHAAGAIDAAAMGNDAVDEQSLLLSLPVSIPIQAVLGTRGGANSDGIMVGTLTHTALADVTEDHQTVFTDLTTEAGDASANDVTLPDPFDLNDAIYFGHGTIFSAIVTDVGTQAVGAAVAAEVAIEYWNGSAWAALTEVEDTSVIWTAGTATYVTSFLPPSDWAATTVDGGSSLFYIRFRGTAADIFNTTQGIVDQVWCLPLATGDGPQMPFDCVVTAIEGTALVASATNDDTEILLINITQGTFTQFTWTGGDLADQTASLTLAFAAGDKYAIQILTEDGSTEFDGVALQLICLVG